MAVTLLIIENSVERFQLVEEDSVFTMGRSTKNQVVLRELVSSRHHCEIRKINDGEGYMLRDLGSRNGTQVNGQFEQMAMLHKGDKITIGSTHIYFDVNNREDIIDQLPYRHEDSPVAVPPPPPPPSASSEVGSDALAPFVPKNPGGTKYEDFALVTELLKVSKDIFEAENLQKCLQLIFESICKNTAANGGIVRLMPHHGERLEFDTGESAKTPVVQNLMDLLFQQLLGQSEEKTLLVKSLRKSEIFEDHEHEDIRSLLGITLSCFEEPVGFIGLYRDKEHGSFREEDEEISLQFLTFGIKALEWFHIQKNESIPYTYPRFMEKIESPPLTSTRSNHSQKTLLLFSLRTDLRRIRSLPR
jgi:pSer/pThr/pTyr-binding forkhead associated (FHA) protein